MRVVLRFFLYSFLPVLLLAGCGGSPEAPDLGGWSLDTESLTLTEEMTTSGTENYLFGDIGALDVTSKGRMIVSDTDAQHLKILRPDGTLIDSLGREGQGPGEFQFVGDVHVGRRDSLYVTDLRASRLSVFAPAAPYEFDRAVSGSNQTRVSRFLVLGNRYAGMVSGGFDPDSDERPPPNVWRVMRADGTLGDTLFTARRRNMKMMEMDGGFMIRPVPFTRRTIVTTGPDDRIYRAWSDSIHVEATSLDGQSEVVASIPTQSISVTSAERDSALADIDDPSMRSKIASAMRDTKPALTSMVVADDGRIWVERPSEGVEADSTTWWRLLPEKETIQAVQLPSEVTLQEVQAGAAYGITETEGGAPAVVRYSVSRRE